MATTQVALLLIATTLVALTVFVWGTIYYVPRILDAGDHADGAHADTGRPS
jgi:hypothetical protein